MTSLWFELITLTHLQLIILWFFDNSRLQEGFVRKEFCSFVIFHFRAFPHTYIKRSKPGRAWLSLTLFPDPNLVVQGSTARQAALNHHAPRRPRASDWMQLYNSPAWLWSRDKSHPLCMAGQTRADPLTVPIKILTISRSVCTVLTLCCSFASIIRLNLESDLWSVHVSSIWIRVAGLLLLPAFVLSFCYLRLTLSCCHITKTHSGVSVFHVHLSVFAVVL